MTAKKGTMKVKKEVDMDIDTDYPANVSQNVIDLRWAVINMKGWTPRERCTKEMIAFVEAMDNEQFSIFLNGRKESC